MMNWYDSPTVKVIFDWQHDETPIIRKVNMNDKVNPCCGIELVCFDKSDIEWLLQGKTIVFRMC